MAQTYTHTPASLSNENAQSINDNRIGSDTDASKAKKKEENRKHTKSIELVDI